MAAGSAAGVELPNGIVVRSLDSSGRNQIWIDIGDDVLAIDVAVAESAQAEMPRFGISTNATGVVRAATELRPEFRLPRDHQADRATIERSALPGFLDGLRQRGLRQLEEGFLPQRETAFCGGQPRHILHGLVGFRDA